MKKINILFLFILLPFTLNAEDYRGFAAVNTIESNFVMQKYMPQVSKKPIESKGKFYFERSSFLRWEYTSPFPSGIILDGKKAYSWKNVSGKKDIKNISSKPFAKMMTQQLLMFVSMDIDAISARFDIKEYPLGLDLMPKNPSGEQTINAIKLHFNKERNAVTKVEMLELGGDKTIITFLDTALNTTIPQNIREP